MIKATPIGLPVALSVCLRPSLALSLVTLFDIDSRCVKKLPKLPDFVNRHWGWSLLVVYFVPSIVIQLVLNRAYLLPK
jgi:hypothetical protein